MALPTGTVQALLDDHNLNGIVATLANGQAALPVIDTTGWPIGAHNLSFQYTPAAGDNNDPATLSAEYPIQITDTTNQVTVTAAGIPASAPQGAQLTIVVTVAH
jgi:hypothetical protein